jgi:lipoate-protein ligase B
MSFRVYRLGLVEYGEAYQLQKELSRQRLSGDIPDTLLLLEHPPTITIGKSGKLENVLASSDELHSQGISLFFTDRGGDVTCHGPGQLMVYPVIDLRQRDRDIHAYVRDLEEVIIRTLNRFAILGHRNPLHAGVWVDGVQIAAIGIAVRRWITMHGMAVNVSPDLTHFGLVNPCGFAGLPVTSISELTGQHVSLQTVAEAVVAEFTSVFGVSTKEPVSIGA